MTSGARLRECLWLSDPARPILTSLGFAIVRNAGRLLMQDAASTGKLIFENLPSSFVFAGIWVYTRFVIYRALQVLLL